MSIPGFTAERSLVATNYRIRLLHRRRNLQSSARIYPALPRDEVEHGCSNICGSEPGCFDECMAALGGDNGGGGGTGGGGELKCGKCIRGRRHCVLPGVGGGWSRCFPGDD
jgi:hypothetical protein